MWTELLTNLLNRYLALDPCSEIRLKNLTGKSIRWDIVGTQFQGYFIFSEKNVTVVTQLDAPVDASLRCSPSALIALMFKQPTPHHFTLSGDAAAAQALQQLLTDVEIDWEEFFAHYCGDTIARPLTRGICQVVAWGRSVKTQFRETFVEYLQEESRDLVTREELNFFNEQVDILRHDTERLLAQFNLRNTLS